MNDIRICQYSFKPPSTDWVIDPTSKAGPANFTKFLSPFFLGPVNLYDKYVSINVENAWQYSKVYKEHLEDDSTVGDKYFSWAQSGWGKEWADRYPMGKGAIPEFSYWDGQRLGYIEARKEIYIPLYSKAVKRSKAFKLLQGILPKDNATIWIKDFDGYDHKDLGMSYTDVINNSNRKMGHAFVLGMILEGMI